MLTIYNFLQIETFDDNNRKMVENKIEEGTCHIARKLPG
jgi:hypothetical protein